MSFALKVSSFVNMLQPTRLDAKTLDTSRKLCKVASSRDLGTRKEKMEKQRLCLSALMEEKVEVEVHWAGLWV